MYGPPIRRGLLVVAVVLLVAVAGCSGLSSDTTPTAEGTPTENGTASPTATPATDTPAPATVTPTPDDVPNQQPPTDDPETDPDSSPEADGTGAGLDGQALNDATDAAVEDAGSYTFQSAFYTVGESQRGRSVSRVTTTTRVDIAAEQGLRTSNQSVSSAQFSQNRSTVVYTEDNTSYRQRTTSEGTNYSTQEGQPTSFGDITPVNTSGFVQNLTFVTDGLVWEANGTTTDDGVTVTEYTLDGVEDADSFIGGSDATLTDIGGTLYVDDEDVVRQLSLAYTVETDSATSTTQLRFALTDIGSTTVEEPDWTAEAEDAGSS